MGHILQCRYPISNFPFYISTIPEGEDKERGRKRRKEKARDFPLSVSLKTFSEKIILGIDNVFRGFMILFLLLLLLLLIHMIIIIYFFYLSLFFYVGLLKYLRDIS